MSSLIGQASGRWSLSRAIDALRDSARQAGRPGLVWVVGLLYPSVDRLFWVSSSSSEGSGAAIPLPAWVPLGICLAVCISITCFPLFRLVAGLARVSPPEVWTEACEARRTPRIRTLWKLGSDMTLSVIGLWLLLVGSIGLSFFAVALAMNHVPWPFGDGAHGDVSRWLLGAPLLGPLVLVFVSYTLAMTVLTQLALHSLAHNRRGIGSALLHGWRIMRHDARATLRAVIVDAVLTVVILIAIRMLGSLIPGEQTEWIVAIPLYGFSGVARAAYWARAYRELGGLSPDDGVPGLPIAQA